MVREGETYIIDHATDEPDKWFVRVIAGDFKGYILAYNNISLDGKTQSMKFKMLALNGDLDAQYDPVTPSEELQQLAFDILEDIVLKQIEKGGIVLNDADSDQ